MKKINLFILLFLSLLLINGCVHVDVNQKLKRNGNTDLTITYKAPEMILDSLKQGMNTNTEDFENIIYQETDESIKITIKNINKEFELDLYEDDSFDDILFNKENFNLEKEFRFPYYYFTYIINFSHEDNIQNQDFDELNQMLNNMFKFTYTIETFGEITETNGNKLNKNKVRFNIADTNEAYVVEFRDFFLISWIGSLF